MSSCDPLDFMIALGKTISVNIAALKEVKRVIEDLDEVRRINSKDTVTSCTEFVTSIEHRESSKIFCIR